MNLEEENRVDGNNKKSKFKELPSTGDAFENFGKLVKMENNCRRWEEMERDVLVKIFQTFDIDELTSGIAQVCSSWRVACCDRILWKTLNLGHMQSNFIKVPSHPYVWVDEISDKKLMLVLKIALGLSCGNVACLIFHLNLYLKDDHLIYTAERTPQLKRLVLPAWNRITKSRICEAICKWKDLESLTMPSIRDPCSLMKVIGENCKNFTQLKVMGPCDILFATTIATFLPKIKVLSLRCSMLHKEALELILESLEHLEVLNISHCLLVEVPPHSMLKNILRELDASILMKASRLRKFIVCQKMSCIFCERVRADEGLMRWYKYEEEFWRADEVSSLAH